MLITDNSYENLPLTIPPAPPTNLAYSDLTSTSVFLTWLPGTGGTPVAYYRIWNGTTDAGQTIGNTPWFFVDNLTPDTGYSFTVYAIGVNGIISIYSSNLANFRTPPFSSLFPPSPVNLREIDIGNTSITLQWDTGTDGTSAVFRYRIYQDGISVGTTTENIFTVTDLAPNTTYNFYIISEAGDGQLGQSPSNQINVTTTALARPASPVNLRTTAVAAGSVTLQWDSGTDGTEPVSYFSVYQNGAFLTNITGYTLALSTLTPGLLYDFFIISVGANGQTGASRSNTLEVIIGTAPALPPAAPLSASYQAISPTSVQLNIIPGGGGGVVNGFAALELYSQTWFFSPGANALIRVDSLIPGQSYYFLVFAVGRDGQRSAGYAQVSFALPLGTASPFLPEGYPYPAPRDKPAQEGYPPQPYYPPDQAHQYGGDNPVQSPW
ncbi:fibronectin type III domain-containing protein [Acerihabitans arboris]|uniref:Fibronectin type-III domain-containing protein n=1 Tax=Acerihabitans arboris TaxID=2691583 RepID=A0A845SSR4_9GAMM|nr:fibronectin type III domain-containing protein [Acerihabitans arboris]NDL66107.1 hypothetical protein [Acerihabitans arboris]